MDPKSFIFAKIRRESLGQEPVRMPRPSVLARGYLRANHYFPNVPPSKSTRPDLAEQCPLNSEWEPARTAVGPPGGSLAPPFFIKQWKTKRSQQQALKDFFNIPFRMPRLLPQLFENLSPAKQSQFWAYWELEYLFSLIETFEGDLVLVHDRYQTHPTLKLPHRSLPELKNQTFRVCRLILESQGTPGPDVKELLEAPEIRGEEWHFRRLMEVSQQNAWARKIRSPPFDVTFTQSLKKLYETAAQKAQRLAEIEVRLGAKLEIKETPSDEILDAESEQKSINLVNESSASGSKKSSPEAGKAEAGPFHPHVVSTKHQMELVASEASKTNLDRHRLELALRDLEIPLALTPSESTHKLFRELCEKILELLLVKDIELVKLGVLRELKTQEALNERQKGASTGHPSSSTRLERTRKRRKTGADN